MQRHLITSLRIARSPFARRQASTTAETVQKATKTAESAQAKAGDALGAAQQTAGKVFEQAKGLGQKLGSGLGNLLGCESRLRFIFRVMGTGC